MNDRMACKSTLNVEEKTMTDYDKLLNRYYYSDGKNNCGDFKMNRAERTSPEFNKELKSNSRRKHRHLILDELLIEIPFHLTSDQIENIRYILDRFNDDFKGFSRNSSNETIILAFIMMEKKHVNSKLDVSNYAISEKYKLTPAKFETIQNRLIFRLMNTTELRYSQAKYVNQEFIQK